MFHCNSRQEEQQLPKGYEKKNRKRDKRGKKEREGKEGTRGGKREQFCRGNLPHSWEVNISPLLSRVFPPADDSASEVNEAVRVSVCFDSQPLI